MNREIGKNIYNLLEKEYMDKGVFYFEMYLNNFQYDKTWCDMAIYFLASKVLVGIELKDWQKPVPYSIVKKEFVNYKDIFDYIYLVANKFSKKVSNLERVGLISKLDDKYKIIKKAEKLKVKYYFKDDFIRRFKKHCDYKLITRSVLNRRLTDFFAPESGD